MLFSRNFDELFIKPDKDSKNWNDKAFELLKKGTKNDLTKHLQTANELYIDDHKIASVISEITLGTTPENRKQMLLNDLKKIKEYVKEAKKEKSFFFIETTKYKIIFMKLSDYIPELKEDDDIETENRLKKCHEKSIEISSRLPFLNYIVTGYVYGLSDKVKYIHSWIEFKKNGLEFVIDCTKNVVMNKDGYYQLEHAQPISKISSQDQKKDEEILYGEFKKIGSFNAKEYLLFRDEIMADFSKNSFLFEEEENR